MSNTASGFIPAGGQLKQTISKGSQTINQNQKIANSTQQIFKMVVIHSITTTLAQHHLLLVPLL